MPVSDGETAYSEETLNQIVCWRETFTRWFVLNGKETKDLPHSKERTTICANLDDYQTEIDDFLAVLNDHQCSLGRGRSSTYSIRICSGCSTPTLRAILSPCSFNGAPFFATWSAWAQVHSIACGKTSGNTFNKSTENSNLTCRLMPHQAFQPTNLD